MSKDKKAPQVPKESRYSKNSFIQSGCYSAMDRDILKLILKDGEKYTREEVKDELEAFKIKKEKKEKEVK